MSRIGRAPITIPAGVEVKVEAGNTVTVKGPKGTLTRTFSPIITIAQEGAEVICTRPDDSKASRSMHGTVRSILNGMVVGVSEGFTKELQVNGIFLILLFAFSRVYISTLSDNVKCLYFAIGFPLLWFIRDI